MKILDGWIFDVYPADREMIVWVIDVDGRAHLLRDAFAPSFFIGGSSRDLDAVRRLLLDQYKNVAVSRSLRTELFSGQPINVLEVQTSNLYLFSQVFTRLTRTWTKLDYYNGDISLPQLYFFERRIFPLAFCHFAVDNNRILGVEVEDSPWALDYKLSPLKRMIIRMEGDAINPNHGHRAPLMVETEDDVRELNGDDPRELLETLRGLLVRRDPDLIVSNWGDSFILPQLLQMSKQYTIPLPFNRDPAREPLFRPPDSYFSYGRIIYKAASQILFGRWHIDRHNAFLAEDYGLDGMIEVARLTQMPIQRVVRTSTGTGISAMQIATAYRHGVLIPCQKHEPEALKTGLDLVKTDKGGLVYKPLTGLHEEAAEIDFVSMYPSIMARFNISPETVNCKCCPDHRVPEIGITVCQKRRGLVPETVEPLIHKRIEYKKRIRAMEDGPLREAYRRRQSAHKWLLVTCFGYLGYKNARFGRIEAHEAVTAYGRECLLRAKEIAENQGYRVLQANVDSVIVQKQSGEIHYPGASNPSDYDALLEEITRKTQIPIALEGVYRWVAFLPSRVDERLSIANRYFGVFGNGELKMRGIETRRRDTPPFIVTAQTEMLKILTTVGTRGEMQTLVPSVIDVACAYADALRAGQVAYQELVITKRLSRDPLLYSKDTLHAIAAKELVGSGIALSPGESIQYIITEENARAKIDRARPLEQYRGDEPYDAKKYIELLVHATQTVLAPLGIDEPQIFKLVTEGLGKEKPTPRQQLPTPVYWGPLFEFAERAAQVVKR